MFLFKLALALGKTVGELEATLSQREFMEWVEYYKLDPFGSFRVDLQTGILGTVIAQVIGGNKRARPAHFMPLQKPLAQVSAKAAAPVPARDALAHQAYNAFMLANVGRKMHVVDLRKRRD